MAEISDEAKAALKSAASQDPWQNPPMPTLSFIDYLRFKYPAATPQEIEEKLARIWLHARP